jgi:hypothetical protein
MPPPPPPPNHHLTRPFQRTLTNGVVKEAGSPPSHRTALTVTVTVCSREGEEKGKVCWGECAMRCGAVRSE